MIEIDSEQALAEVIRVSASVEILGGGSKRGLGQPVQAERQLRLSGLSGVTLYEPAELILTAKAGTRLTEITTLLAAQNQCLAFEPPDLSRLLGTRPAEQTMGGVVATNLSGPRRIAAGAVRDHLLGLRAVNGRGEIFRAGGRVVKNVTGYDLCKLLTGSFGTMAVFTEVTLKVLPAAETEETLVLSGLDAAQAVTAMCTAMASSASVSGAAFLPCPDQKSLTLLRLEGLAESVAARRESLRSLLAVACEIWPAAQSRAQWRDLRDVIPLAGAADRAVWKISLAATQTPAFLARLRTRFQDLAFFLDWAGALIWLSLPCGEDAKSDALRALLPEQSLATLILAPDRIRAGRPVFQPQPMVQAALEEKIRRSFDPERKLNPGRMTLSTGASSC